MAARGFVSPPFKLERMTWIKPSFLWMMYRCGWGQKDKGQSRVLAIDISREGFEWALEHSCLSHRPNRMSDEDWNKRKINSPVRIQWDPERDIDLNRLDYRSIQIGLSGVAVEKYVQDWIVNVTDITQTVHSVHHLILKGERDVAIERLPKERPLDVPDDLARKLGLSA